MAFDQAVQVMAALFRKELARQFYRAQQARNIRQADAPELVPEKAIVKTRVVRNQDLALETFEQAGRKLGESGRVLHHRVADAGERLDERRMPLCGFTSWLQFPTRTPARTSTSPISVMRSCAAAMPVVSRSRKIIAWESAGRAVRIMPAILPDNAAAT